MKDFDNFDWILSHSLVQEKKLPNEKSLVLNFGCNIGMDELYFVKSFYVRYKYFSASFIQKELEKIDNEIAKVWISFAIDSIPFVVEYENEYFQEYLDDLLGRLTLPMSNLIELFRPYMPFITNKDCYQFALDHLDSPLYRHFYLLLIFMYEDDYPEDPTIRFPHTYMTCPTKDSCKFKDKCFLSSKCYRIKAIYGEGYDHHKEMMEFQKEITHDFISAVPKGSKNKALVKLYESFQQINQTGLFASKLALSYNKILYNEGMPMNGSFYLSWDKVEFYNGFYLVKHPDVPFNKVQPYRIVDVTSRKVFNDISNVFLRKLPPIHVLAKDGRIIKILNQPNLSSCISVMEHKIMRSVPKRKNVVTQTKQRNILKELRIEKKEVGAKVAKNMCKQFKSRFLDYLCSKQLNTYKVICCIEHRVNSVGSVACEYSFIFTIKENANKIFLAYENTLDSRCT